jgi:hypothetical protein
MRTAASRLFSSYARALWVAAAAGAALLAFALVFDLGGDAGASDRRNAVARYLGAVNMTQQLMVEELDGVSRAYRKLELTPEELEEVQRAHDTLAAFRADVAAVEAPPEAATLRRQLLRLFDLEVAFAAEVVELVRYLPIEVRSSRALAAATKRLRSDLVGAKTATAQKGAFARYGVTVGKAAATLAAAEAPPVLAASQEREVARFRKLAGLAEQLGRAFEDKRAQDVDALFRRFAGTTSAAGATARERKAVIAFNRRRGAIQDQLLVVASERTRLDRTLR